MAHSAQTFTHALTLLLVSSVLATLIPTTEGKWSVWIVAVVSALLAQPFRALLSYFYRAWSHDVESFQTETAQFHETRRVNSTLKLRKAFGQSNGRFFNAPSESTLQALENIEFVEESEEDSDAKYNLDAQDDIEVVYLDRYGDAALPPDWQPNAPTAARYALQILRDQSVEFEDDDVALYPIGRVDDGVPNVHASVSGGSAQSHSAGVSQSAGFATPTLTSVVPNSVTSESREIGSDPQRQLELT
jgi:hypothetical protein